MKKFFSILTATILPFTAFAAEEPKLENPLGDTTDYLTLLHDILSWLLGITGAFATVYFIYGGFLILTSAGNPEKVKKGKDALVYAVIGMIVIILSYSILQFFFDFFSNGAPA